MAKKTVVRRVPSSVVPHMYGDGKPSQSARAAQTGTRAVANARPGAASGVRAVVSFAQEYAYVAGDLKRLGLTAVGLFAVLVVLSFIIR